VPFRPVAGNSRILANRGVRSEIAR
jgi:hypothetical protein